MSVELTRSCVIMNTVIVISMNVTLHCVNHIVYLMCCCVTLYGPSHELPQSTLHLQHHFPTYYSVGEVGRFLVPLVVTNTVDSVYMLHYIYMCIC